MKPGLALAPAAIFVVALDVVLVYGAWHARVYRRLMKP